jgi:hypothetical protein
MATKGYALLTLYSLDWKLKIQYLYGPVEFVRNNTKSVDELGIEATHDLKSLLNEWCIKNRTEQR